MVINYWRHCWRPAWWANFIGSECELDYSYIQFVAFVFLHVALVVHEHTQRYLKNVPKYISNTINYRYPLSLSELVPIPEALHYYEEFMNSQTASRISLAISAQGGILFE